MAPSRYRYRCGDRWNGRRSRRPPRRADAVTPKPTEGRVRRSGARLRGSDDDSDRRRPPTRSRSCGRPESDRHTAAGAQLVRPPDAARW